MSFAKKMIGLVAGVALVATPVAMAVAPAQAAPAAKATGTTLISFKKEYAGIIKLIKPIAPAEFIGSRISFPVTGVTGKTITHSGGLEIGGVPATDPVIVVNSKKKTATISLTVGGNLTPLFYAEHFKVKAGGGKATVWQGDLHLTKDETLVGLLNQLIPGGSLTPGLGLGQIRVTYRVN